MVLFFKKEHFLLLLLALAAPAYADCQLAAVAVLPLRQEHGHFLFTADINTHPANFVLDTGAFATSLNRASADRLGVRLSQLDKLTYGIGGAQAQYRGVAKRMRVGQMNADGMVIGGNDLWSAQRFPDWDGLFGMNMMAAYDIDLDIVGGHAILFEADGNCRKPTVALAPPLYRVKLEPARNDREADVILEIDGHPIRAKLDTGAVHSVMYRRAASRLGVDLSAFNAPTRATVVGIGRFAVPYMSHVFAKVRIGELSVHNMDIGIIAQQDSGIDRVHVGSLLPGADAPDDPGGEDMLLGADFFTRFHVWISHSSQSVILQYPPVASVLPR